MFVHIWTVSQSIFGRSRFIYAFYTAPGCSQIKIFWKIIIPYLEQTILVIWTIITLLVLKVFDIIYAMTNGQWQTEVLANLMYDWMFRGGGDTGRGSVLAFCILIGVIPILAWNLYRHKQDQKV